MEAKTKATASLVCGIISILICWTGYGAIAGIVLGIIAVVLASKAKKENFTDGTQKGGFITGIVGIVLNALGFLIAVIIVGVVIGAAASEGFSDVTTVASLLM